MWRSLGSFNRFERRIYLLRSSLDRFQEDLDGAFYLSCELASLDFDRFELRIYSSREAVAGDLIGAFVARSSLERLDWRICRAKQSRKT